eukprot:SAG31_NODE_1370_length_8610_cov_2.897192_8_plen_377_part_00
MTLCVLLVVLADAFTTWKLPNGSYYSFRNNVPGARDFSVGLERATVDGGRTLGGPRTGGWAEDGAGWAYDNNSVPFPCGPENPIVSKSSDGKWYYAVYDALEQVPNDGSKKGSCADPTKRSLCKSKTQCDAIGVAWSLDGLTWTANATTVLRVQTNQHPCGQIRTPLGLVPEPELCSGCYSVLWTGYSDLKGTDRNGYTPVCHAVIKQKNEAGAHDIGQLPVKSIKSDDAAAALDVTGCYRQDGSGNGFDKPVYGHAGHVYLKQDGRNITGCISQFCFSTLDGDLTVTENEVGMLRLTRHGGNCTAGRLENGSVIPAIAYFLFVFPRGYAGEPTTGSFVNNWESASIPGHAGWLSLNKTVEEECMYMRHAGCMGPL